MEIMNESYEEKIDRLLRITHEPVNMPRESCIGEQVFYAEWKKLMKQELHSLDDATIILEHILSDLLMPVSERHATVCASMVRWLGTNCGRSFLHDATRFADSGFFTSKSRAFLACWALENYRQRAFNSGRRVTEHLLRHYETGYSLHPEPSSDDYEVLEHLVFWLGSSDGISFVHGCQAKIDELSSIQATIERINSEALLLNRRKEALMKFDVLTGGEVG